MDNPDLSKSLEHYAFSKEPPEGLNRDLRLTFDEFYNYGNQIVVYKHKALDRLEETTTIHEACEAMRTRVKGRKYSYTFSISSVPDLDMTFSLPKIVEEEDLFSLYWPFRSQSKYLKERNKLFSGLQKGYRSLPKVVYGGMSEWLQVISGQLELTIITPTFLNRTRYYSLDNNETMKAENSFTCLLGPGQFIIIPGGYITLRRAKLDTFVLSGEYLSYKHFKPQLEHFEDDLTNTECRYLQDRDREIRYLYWFTAAKMLEQQEKAVLSSLSDESLAALRGALTTWKICTDRKITKFSGPFMDHYRPPGLSIEYILRDLKNMISRSRQR